MKQGKIIATFAFVFTLLLSLNLVAGAVGTAVEIYPDSYSINTSHDTTQSFSFKIYNDGNSDGNETLVNLTKEISNLVSGPNTISNSSITISTLPNSIANNTNSSSISVSIKIPEYQKSGVYTGTIKIDSRYNESGDNPSGISTIDLSINVSENKKLTVSDAQIQEGDNSTIITIKNEGNVDLDDINLSDSGDFNVEFNETSTFSLVAGKSRKITVTANSDDLDDLDLGTSEIIVTAADGTVNATGKISYVKDFCDDANDAKLKINDLELDVNEGFGDEDDYWYPLDEVEITFEVENDGSWDVEDIEIEICVFDKEANECILDEGDMDLDEDDFDLDEGDDLEVTATFQVDPDELRAGNEDYTVFVKATGQIDDKAADTKDGDNTCVSDEKTGLEIVTTDDFVIADRILVRDISNPSNNDNEAYCGSDIEISFDLWNIGEKDLDDDELYLELYNKELGILKQYDIDEISYMDYEPITKILTIPEDLTEKTYAILISIYDDNDYSSNDLYELGKDDDEVAEYKAYIAISNCKKVVEPTITASLESDAKVGKELTVEVTIKNNGDEDGVFAISLGDADWAEELEISPAALDLKAGESKTVTITMNPLEAGEQTFTIKTTSDGEITEQLVSVNIKESSGFLTGAFLGVSTVTGWLIVGIILLAIIILIVAIIKLLSSHKKTRHQHIESSVY